MHLHALGAQWYFLQRPIVAKVWLYRVPNTFIHTDLSATEPSYVIIGLSMHWCCLRYMKTLPMVFPRAGLSTDISTASLPCVYNLHLPISFCMAFCWCIVCVAVLYLLCFKVSSFGLLLSSC